MDLGSWARREDLTRWTMNARRRGGGRWSKDDGSKTGYGVV
jgi:hypothetical protein